jgi:hypothetical protein
MSLKFGPCAVDENGSAHASRMKQIRFFGVLNLFFMNFICEDDVGLIFRNYLVELPP